MGNWRLGDGGSKMVDEVVDRGVDLVAGHVVGLVPGHVAGLAADRAEGLVAGRVEGLGKVRTLKRVGVDDATDLYERDCDVWVHSM